MDSLLADGFDFPIGDVNGNGGYISICDKKKYDSWYVATHTAEVYSLGIHTGEDWNGSGGGNTDLGQAVYATACGKVIYAGECPSPWGNVVLLEHHWIENGEIKTVFSQYAHLLEIKVQKGSRVQKRQQIGTIGQGNEKEYPAHLHFEIRKDNMRDYAVDYWPSSHKKDVEWVKSHYEDASSFIKKNRVLTVPNRLNNFILVDKTAYQLTLYNHGKKNKTYEIALSQAPVGQKEKEGDLKVPEGQYKICEKSKGPFSGNWSYAYLGVRWLRLNYPNSFDAERALKHGKIAREQYRRIISAHKNKQVPPKNTGLGGGIGIHGWIEKEWSNDGNRDLTWGCLSMHKKDLIELYDLVDTETIVVIRK